MIACHDNNYLKNMRTQKIWDVRQSKMEILRIISMGGTRNGGRLFTCETVRSSSGV